jgi:hypothetical protein
MKRLIECKAILVMLAGTACGAANSASDNGSAGSGGDAGGSSGGSGGGGGAGGVGSAAMNREEFVEHFLAIICGPSNTEGSLPHACTISNGAGMNHMECLWKRADFSNDGSQKPMSEELRSLLSDGGAKPLCPTLNTPGYSCGGWLGTYFPASQRGRIWDNSGLKPIDAAQAYKSCE